MADELRARSIKIGDAMWKRWQDAAAAAKMSLTALIVQRMEEPNSLATMAALKKVIDTQAEKIAKLEANRPRRAAPATDSELPAPPSKFSRTAAAIARLAKADGDKPLLPAATSEVQPRLKGVWNPPGKTRMR